MGCCVQLLTLASISAERYQAIAHPFKTSQRKRRVKIWIPLTWTLAVLVSSFCITIAEDTPVYVKCRGIRVEVLTSFDTFGLYILVPIWFASLTVIIGFYGRIFIVVRAHTKKIFDKGTSSLPPPAKKGKDVRIDGKQLADKTNSEEENKSKANNDTRWLGNKASLTAVVNPKAGTKTSVPIDAEVYTASAAAFSDLPVAGNRSVALPSISVIPEETVEERPTSHAVKTTPGCLSSLPSSTGEYSQGNLFKPGVSVDPAPVAVLTGFKVSIAETHHVETAQVQCLSTSPAVEGPSDHPPDPPAVAPQADEVAGAVCMMPSSFSRERAKAGKEGKLAKRSGYIVITFIAFWMPLIISVLMNPFTLHNPGTVQKILEVETFAVALACMTAAVNPITYAVVNPQFRSEFRQLKTKYKSKLFSKT
nr:PREDICTED: uncharacterized protein LOC102687357 [Lepisosteus oculatus]